jgi:peptide/nickel transport system substrate-binding protein
MIAVSRRTLCQALGISVAGAPAWLRSASVLAADMDKVTIGWPTDVPSWDPEQRTVPDPFTRWCSINHSIRRPI